MGQSRVVTWNAKAPEALIFLTFKHLLQDHDPQALTEEEVTKLTREDATQRFLDAAEIKSHEWPGWLTGVKDGLTWPVINAGTVSFLVSTRSSNEYQPSLLLSRDFGQLL